jgi:hypothetical protein
MLRLIAVLLGLTLLGACTEANPQEPLADLGEFRLGHNIVVAPKMATGPISRPASKEEWIDSLTKAVDARFGQYQGSQLYHFGMSVEGFMLAPPGVPVIYSPKSALIVRLTVWDDAAAKKLHEPETFTIFETTTAETFVAGSGNNRTREEQMEMLSRNAVAEIEDWLIEQQKEHGWFNKRPETEGATTAAPVAPAQAAAAPAAPPRG